MDSDRVAEIAKGANDAAGEAMASMLLTFQLLAALVVVGTIPKADALSMIEASIARVEQLRSSMPVAYIERALIRLRELHGLIATGAPLSAKSLN